MPAVHRRARNTESVAFRPDNSHRCSIRVMIMPECYKMLARTKGKLLNRTANMPRQTTPVRIGIIGCGNVLSAYRATIDKLRLRGLAGVVAACGRPSQRTAACAELGIQQFTTDAQEVIAAPDVDVVVILTSMSEHAQLARAA